MTALCAEDGMDPSWWDLDDPNNETAAMICRRCPLMVECRERASAGLMFGVWGGWSFFRGRRQRTARIEPAGKVKRLSYSPGETAEMAAAALLAAHDQWADSVVDRARRLAQLDVGMHGRRG